MKRNNAFFKRRDAWIQRYRGKDKLPWHIAQDAFAAGWKARGKEEKKGGK